MTIVKITRASDALAIWPFFAEGLAALEEINKFHYDELQAKKMLCKVASDKDHGFISICYSDTGEPLAFAVAQEDTLLFSNFRTFVARAVYYRQGHSSSLVLLMGHFEEWCRANRIRRYTVHARRPTTAAKRCFKHEQYAFRKMSLVFEKDLT